jgi:putrescine transport system substrate-binding protein
VAKLREILGAGSAIEGWSTAFAPAQLARFKNCGVEMLDSADDMFPVALRYLGRDPNSTETADLEAAADVLTKVRPSVRKFHSSDYINALASGEICFAVAWSGDVKQAQKRAREAKNGIEIGYVVPREGTEMFFDNLAIPRDAPNPNEAHAFIDYLMRSDVAARNTDAVSYANGNLASQALIDPAILNDRTIYPDDATMARLFTVAAHDIRTTRLMNRMWTKIKTGR